MEDGYRFIRYNLFIVNINTLTPSQHSIELHEVCDQLRRMGYAQSKRIRIYGQEFEAVSNPFPNGDGIAIRAFSKRETQARTLQLPLPVVQMVNETKTKKSSLAVSQAMVSDPLRGAYLCIAMSTISPISWV